MTDKAVDAVACTIPGVLKEEFEDPLFQARDYYRDIARQAIAAYEGAIWQPIETAPRDGTIVIVATNSMDEDLPAFTTWAAYHPDAGWCVDDLREATHWRPLPQPPEGAK